MLHIHNIIVDSQVGITFPNMQGLCFACLFCVLLPILFSLITSIINIKSLFGSRITFGALWEGNIPFEKRHIRVMKTNVLTVFFGLSLYLFKIWTWSSHRMWKTRLQILCIVFVSQFGIISPKITNLCFAFTHQTTHLWLCSNE